MSSRLLLLVLALGLGLGTTGCFSFGRKSKQVDPAKQEAKEAKISKTPVADMEKGFKSRWVAKRAAELVAGGMNSEQAQVQALADYDSAYRYTTTAK